MELYLFTHKAFRCCKAHFPLERWIFSLFSLLKYCVTFCSIITIVYNSVLDRFGRWMKGECCFGTKFTNCRKARFTNRYPLNNFQQFQFRFNTCFLQSYAFLAIIKATENRVFFKGSLNFFNCWYCMSAVYLPLKVASEKL